MTRRCTCTDTLTCGPCERAISAAEDLRDYGDPIVLDDELLASIEDTYAEQLDRQRGDR